MSTYSITVKTELTPKQGVTENATFGITQSRPYPRLDSRIEWANDDRVLFRSYGSDPTGLAEKYHVSLLTPEGPWNADTRGSHAGFDGNPGSLTYRGHDLGELTAEVSRCHGDGWWFQWRVDGQYPGSQSVRDYLTKQVEPAITKAIEDGADTLKQDAIRSIKAHMAQTIKEAREAIDEAAKQADEALAQL